MQAIMKKNRETTCFYVVHPLDDHPEVKRNADDLGPMTMPAGAKWSLISLHGYLVLMGLMVVYSSLSQTGMFGH